SCSDESKPPYKGWHGRTQIRKQICYLAHSGGCFNSFRSGSCAMDCFEPRHGGIRSLWLCRRRPSTHRHEPEARTACRTTCRSPSASTRGHRGSENGSSVYGLRRELKSYSGSHRCSKNRKRFVEGRC